MAAEPAEVERADPADKCEEGADERRRPGRRPLIVLAAVVAVLVIGGGWYYLATRDQESTDDAFTDGNTVTIAPKVTGYVVELDVDDNTRVKAGDLMVRIDPRDFVAARHGAAAALAVAKAQAENARINLHMVQVTAPARLAAAQARAQVEINQLVQQNIEQASAQVEQLEAQVRQAQAQLAQAARPSRLSLQLTAVVAPDVVQELGRPGSPWRGRAE
jgi:membrane fusion protein (multidrug efflux system)